MQGAVGLNPWRLAAVCTLVAPPAGNKEEECHYRCCVCLGGDRCSTPIAPCASLLTFCKEFLGHCATGLEREAPNAARPSPPRPPHGGLTPSEDALEGLLRCIAHLPARLRGALSSPAQQQRNALCDENVKRCKFPVVPFFLVMPSLLNGYDSAESCNDWHSQIAEGEMPMLL